MMKEISVGYSICAIGLIINVLQIIDYGIESERGGLVVQCACWTILALLYCNLARNIAEKKKRVESELERLIRLIS